MLGTQDGERAQFSFLRHTPIALVGRWTGEQPSHTSVGLAVLYVDVRGLMEGVKPELGCKW